MNRFKSIVFAFSVLAGLAWNASSTAATPIGPNFFQLRDTLGGTEIVWDQHLITPSLTYKVAGKARTFSGPDITVNKTAIGQLLTVTLQFRPDVDFTTLSIFIPEMTIPDVGGTLSFSSTAIVTVHRSPLTAPPITGVIEIYRTPVVFTGTAKAVP